MKCLLVAAVVLLSSAFTPVALGRVGETLEQCTKRYGNPTPKLSGDKPTLVRFKQGDKIQIQCYFDGTGDDAKCEAICVGKDLGEILELDQVNQILAANKGASEWEKPTKQSTPLGVQWQWRTRDGKLLASSILGSLVVETRERRERDEAERQAKQRQEVGNF